MHGRFAISAISFILMLLMFLSVSSAEAETYYVRDDGLDANDGLSNATAWQTLSKVNSETFNPGDIILFQKGDVWHGTLNITSSGTSANPILYSSYGSGNNPVIYGFEAISSWTNEGGGIYSSAVAAESTPHMVLINGTIKGLGRYPDNGYLRIDTHVGSTSISDATIEGVQDWTGAEVVIRKTHWIIDTSKITSHVGETLTYDSGSEYEAQDGYGYFIQSHIDTLTSLGEWYYEAGKIYVFFGTENPSNYDVKVSTVDKLVYAYFADNVIIDGLNLIGANKAAVYFYLTNNNTVRNCNISYSGLNGFYGETDMYLHFNNNSVSYCLNMGVYCDINGHHIHISNNTIKNIGLIPGMEVPYGAYANAVNINGVDGIVEHNFIENIGYIGIDFKYNNTLVQNNFINNVCLIKDDCAGIYTYTGATGVSYNKSILNNIVTNAVGNSSGTDDPSYLPANGIYLDENVEYVNVSGNTVANAANYGIFLHGSRNSNIEKNIVYNSTKQQFRATRPFIAFPVQNITLKDNIFIASNASQLVFAAINHRGEDLNFFNADNNYFCRPDDDNLTFYTQLESDNEEGTYRSLENWKLYSGQDTSSRKCSKAENSSNIHLYMNPSNSGKNIDIGSAYYVDIYGGNYTGNFTLQPFASSILILSAAPIPPQPEEDEEDEHSNGDSIYYIFVDNNATQNETNATGIAPVNSTENESGGGHIDYLELKQNSSAGTDLNASEPLNKSEEGYNKTAELGETTHDKAKLLSFAYYFLIAVAVILLAVLLLAAKKKKPSANKQLLSFIENSIAAGYSAQSIESVLLQRKVPIDVISYHLRLAKNPEVIKARAQSPDGKIYADEIRNTLQKYILTQKKLRFPDNEIRKVLANKGYSNKVIDEMMQKS